MSFSVGRLGATLFTKRLVLKQISSVFRYIQTCKKKMSAQDFLYLVRKIGIMVAYMWNDQLYNTVGIHTYAWNHKELATFPLVLCMLHACARAATI